MRTVLEPVAAGPTKPWWPVNFAILVKLNYPRTVDIAGVLLEEDEPRTFQRNDGQTGYVKDLVMVERDSARACEGEGGEGTGRGRGRRPAPYFACARTLQG